MPGVRLRFEERELIQAGVRCGLSIRSIADQMGRAPSTVSREVRRNRSGKGYRAGWAHQMAHQRARRPKTFKLECHKALTRRIDQLIQRGWSPEQVAAWLRNKHPDDSRWWVSPEAIYHSLYVQGRGGLKEELTKHLRRARSKRKSHYNPQGHLKDVISIAERPPEADDRAVPGHWEGDLILGHAGASQVGMLAERTSRYLLLFRLPDDRSAPTVREALAKTIRRLPQQLVRSLTWDQGKEMAQHVQLTIDTGVQIYFCDPGSPWQRGTAENTIGLTRQYLPKNEDLSRFTQADLNKIALLLNTRPRKTLGWKTPAEAYAEIVDVASTA